MTRAFLRYCYYKGRSTQENIVRGFKDQVIGAGDFLVSAGRTWWSSPSIFYPSPFDVIAEQQVYDIERNFLKINGFECPPLQPDTIYRGCVRVEYYSGDKDTQRMYEGKWDCWADVPMTDKGGLKLTEIQTSLGVDVDHLVIMSPTRWKPFPLDRTRPLTPLEIRCLTCDYKVPLKIFEQNLPLVTHTKRHIRHAFLLFWAMLTALIDLLRLQAYDEFDFGLPLPWWFLWFYNLARSIHPATRRQYEAPDMDILASPRGGQHLLILPDPVERKTQERIGRLLSSCQTTLSYRAMVFVTTWLLVAELVSCVSALSNF